MNDIIDYFRKKGMKNPLRSISLIKEAIEYTMLDLTGLIIFTEAASGEFIYTPIIAAMAKAKKVYAITADSKYCSKESVKNDTLLFAKLCGVEGKIEVVYDKKDLGKADIVTNLGFVRPIDKKTIDKMKSTAVIPYMCEAWEIRDKDVDIDYCKKKGIKIMGTNESYPGLEIFNFSGMLALKMLFDAGIEVFKSKIVILSKDKFGKVIYSALSKHSSKVILLKELNEKNIDFIRNMDVLFIADYTSKECFVGGGNKVLNGKKLRDLSENITVIQFAGLVETEDLRKNNIIYYPEYQVGSVRMGKTLAYLGPKPVISLHCSGLKVGEIMCKDNLDTNREKGLCQKI